MDIQSHIQNSLIKLRVIPNSSKTELIEENNKLKLYLKSIPYKIKPIWNLSNSSESILICE